jgi:L-seryl-tRNA(Ser) seleniumtransferase
VDPARPPDMMRALPSVDRVLRAPALAAVREQYAHDPLVRLVRRMLDDYREDILAGSEPPSFLDITENVLARVVQDWATAPSPILNASGVILHTNLGRAPLSTASIEAMRQAAGYVDLEMNVRSGDRESRLTRVGRMLQDLTGAEAATVVVNNAAAVLLALAGLARGREVIVSRGQAVEIGGGFRIPSVLRQSGARLVEVGTTNRTRIPDYEEAIGPRTAALLQVHSSNFKIIGFAEEVPVSELASLAHQHGLLLISDNGSGALVDTSTYGLPHEPTPMDALAAGVDVVCFSGDKLLGGPQSGIILGSRDAIGILSRHPLARAVRLDKIALSGLAGTLQSYLRGRPTDVPVISMIAMPVGEIEARAGAWRDAAAGRGLPVTLTPGESTVGGGSLPTETLPTVLLELPQGVRAAALRRAQPSVIARTRGNRVLLDLRTIQPADEPALLDVVTGVAARA